MLQLGKSAGAPVIATASSEEKLELCRRLGADVVVNCRTDDFVEAVDEETHGRGVDVAFDAVGGEVTQQTFRCMAFNGRHVIAGYASGIEQEDEGVLSPRAMTYGNFSLVDIPEGLEAMARRETTGRLVAHVTGLPT